MSKAAYFLDLKNHYVFACFRIVNPLHALPKSYLTLFCFKKNRFAITLGSIGDYESTQEKIKNGYVFKVNLKLYIVEKLNYVRSNAK